MRYRVTDTARIEFSDPLLGGLVACEFEPGTVQAKSEQEAVALERLVVAGYAARLDDGPADVADGISKARRKPAQKEDAE